VKQRDSLIPILDHSQSSTCHGQQHISVLLQNAPPTPPPPRFAGPTWTHLGKGPTDAQTPRRRFFSFFHVVSLPLGPQAPPGCAGMDGGGKGKRGTKKGVKRGVQRARAPAFSFVLPFLSSKGVGLGLRRVPGRCQEVKRGEIPP
jgi:hypothetical protein